MEIHWLHELGRDDTPRAGGKGAHLGEMLRLGLPVPRGFCIPTQAYRAQIQAWNLPARLAPLLRSGDREGAAALAAAACRSRPLLPEVETAIRRAYRQLAAISTGAAPSPDAPAEAGPLPAPLPTVAVRSSATAEDRADASFAGQQETFLGVQGEAALLAAVRGCWASLWTPRALHYREQRGVDHLEAAMAVVVQEMIRADAAGVLFTVDPVTHHRDQILVEAAPGLGEAVVSGAVTGERYRVGRPQDWSGGGDGEPSSHSGSGGGEASPHPRLKVLEQEHPTPGPPLLRDEEILALAQMALRLEAHFGTPQDVEFARSGGRLYLLQTRPITTLSGPEPEPLPPPPKLDLWQRLFLPVTKERYPLAPRPLDNLLISLIIEATTQAMRAAGFATSAAAEEALKSQIWRELYLAFPPLRPTWRLFLGPWHHHWVLAQDWQRWWDEEARPRLLAVTAPVDLASLTDADLLARADAILAAVREVLPRRMVGAGGQFAEGPLRALLLLLLGPREAPRVAADLMAGVETHTTATNAALWALSREARAEPAVAAAVARGEPGTLSSFPAGRAFLRSFAAFLAEYGHRDGTAWYLSTPTWRQEPAQVWRLLQGLVAAETPPTTAATAAGRQRYEAALARVEQRLRWAPWLSRWVHWLVARLRSLLAFRENSHFDLTRPLAALQELAAEWGRRLTERGFLERPEDVFYLTHAEVRRWLLTRPAAEDAAGHRTGQAAGQPDEPPAGPAAIRRLVARRRATYRVVSGRWQARLFQAGNGPHGESRQHGRWRLWRWLWPLWPWRPWGRHRRLELRGVAAAPGVVRARARVVRSEADWHRLQPGEVMVCPYTNPAWTPLFKVAAGVVTETGGAGAHAAIVAREYGVAAVMGVPGATGRIVDGQEVLVDGDAGRVMLGLNPPQRG